MKFAGLCIQTAFGVHLISKLYREVHMFTSMRSIAILATAMLAIPVTSAQADAPTGDAPRLMTLEDGMLHGPGATLLTEGLDTTQFIMFGENHGFADSPELALALSKIARPYGYRHHVVEIGPESEKLVSARLQTGGASAIGELLEGRPLAIPFLNFAEDLALADYFVDNAGEVEDPLWGVDQEFVGSPRLHFETLLAMATTADQATLISALQQDEVKAFASGDQRSVFMFTAMPARFDDLDAAFAGNGAALAILKEMRASANIYQLYASNQNFASNTTRINYIRDQFLKAYHESPEAAPRAIFKFGAIHMARGTTSLNTFDLGSLTEGIAAANNLSVLRIGFFPLAGQAIAMRPSTEGPFSVIDHKSEQVGQLLELMQVSEDRVPERGYIVLPLAPLRHQLGQSGLNALPADAKAFILGFDYIITTRGARPATPVALE